MSISLIHVKSDCFLLKNTAIFLLTAFTLVLISTSCDTNDDKSHISQGILQYEITYINQNGKKFPIQLMPKTMELRFNKEFSTYTIEDRLGLFSIKNTQNHIENKHITLIKVFDKKYIYIGQPKEQPILFDSSVGYKINYRDDTSRVAGFLCKKADIIDSQTNNNFSIYYTNNIEINKPNKNTPYEAIDGMLLSFRLHMKSLDMQLNAKKFEHKVIENSQFEIPKGYKQISRKQMEEIITTILP